MNKPCAKCEKTVFPMEELKCLDKTWHKGCFKCTECGMTLNMKTYKGFNKSPYCEAHIPKAKATTVADTPEMKRIQENTKIQSNAVYHAEFERQKGKFTPVTDDPELLRIKQNSKIISNAAYHDTVGNKAKMEERRTLTEDGDHNSNGNVPSKSPSYMDELASVPTQAPPQQRYGPPPTNSASTAYSSRGANNYHHSGMGGAEHKQPQQQQQQYHPPPPQQQQYHHAPAQHHQQQHPLQSNPSPYSSRGSANLIYTSDGGQVNVNNSSRQPGSIADYDPVNNYFGSLDPQMHGQSRGGVRGQPQQHQQPQQQQMRGGMPPAANNGRVGGGPQMQASHHGQPQAQQQPTRAMSNSVCYRALYDYEAQDMDEVSFMDGDYIVDCTPIDEGWLTGTVQRTGLRGMLPANYVSSAN